MIETGDTANPTKNYNGKHTNMREAHLVDQAAAFRMSVGDGLDDMAFTLLLRRLLPAQAEGFEIICFSEGCLTLCVPRQDFRKWYTAEAWILPDREELARALAAKHQLNVCVPPDHASCVVPSSGTHHHLEFVNRWETVAVAHPYYLKIRLFTSRTSNRVGWMPTTALPRASELARDLMGLYR